MKHTKEQIAEYRQHLFEELCKIKENGKPYLTEDEARKLADSPSDDSLDSDMDYSSPELMADILTM